jgi:carboxymethylenebutenolidase
MHRRLLLGLGLTLLVTAPVAAQENQLATNIPDAILGTAPEPQGIAARYVAGDESTQGYLAVPEGDGPFPALILIHEWHGLTDRVRQVADAFAAQGYIALAADLYQGRTGSNRDENMALMQEARGNMDAVVANLDAAQRFLRSRPDVSGKIGVMGWCFGGGMALSYGLGGEHHHATAIFYGSLVEDPEVLRALTRPVYGTFAENDRGIPVDQVERFAAALDSLGVENDIHIYDHVSHGFWLRVDDDPETRREPAQHAWDRLLVFLSATLLP